jgi:nucleotide-binding universal stress UspA family protein
MTFTERPVVAAVDGSDSDSEIVRWAVADARARSTSLRIVCAFGSRTTYPMLATFPTLPDVSAADARHRGDRIVDRARNAAIVLDPELPIDGAVLDGSPAQVLVEESSRAAVMVLGSRRLGPLGASLLGSVSSQVPPRSHCPVVILRGPTALAAQTPLVVVGVDSSESAEAVLAFAFEYASWHGAPLRAVLCWRHDVLATLSWRAEPSPPPMAEMWLSEALSGWGEKYPDVSVSHLVVRRHPIDGLLAESAAAGLLVVGTRGSNAVASMMLGSVSQGLVHHATCPVVVVPAHSA